jgi:hypothetical protein
MGQLLLLLALELAIAIACYLAVDRNARRAMLLLLAVTAPLEVYRTPILDVNVSLFRLSLLAAVVTVLVTPSIRGRFPGAFQSRLPLCYGALAGLMLISLVSLSDNVGLGARLTGQVVVGTIAIACVATLAAGEPPARLMRYLIAGSALPILAAGWQRLSLELGGEGVLPLLSLLPVPEGLEVTREPVSTFEGTLRLRGTFGDPTHFGAYLTIVAAVIAGAALASLRNRDRRAASVYGLLLVVAVAVTVGTYSRSAWLGMGTALAIVAVASWMRLIRERPGSLLPAAIPVGLAAVFIVLSAPFAPTIEARLGPSQQSNVVSNTAHERTVSVALDELADNPLAGIGLADLGPKLDQAVRTSGAHSSYLTVAAELGGAGLLLLIAALVFAVQRLLSARSASDQVGRLLLHATTAGYAGFAVASLFYDLWWDDFHWVVLGLIASLPVAMEAPAGSTPATVSRRHEAGTSS